MRLLFYSNPPWANTGYGGDMRNICSRLKVHHTIAIHCNCGLYDKELDWNGIKCYPEYPTLGSINPFNQSFSSLEVNFKAWEADIAILHYDTGVMSEQLLHTKMPYLAYVPIDSDPPSPSLIDSLRNARKIISICNWQKKILEDKYNMHSVVIPNGVDSKIFHPAENKEFKLYCRRTLNIPEDKFVFLMVGANRDIRKGYAEMLEAYSRFIHENKSPGKDSMLYIHTDMEGSPGAYNLYKLIKLFDISDNVMFTNQSHIDKFSDEDMGNLYRAADVFVNCSQGEGFGKCIAEAGACGLPSIVTDFTAMTELVIGHGFPVGVAAKQCQNLSLGFRAIPDIDDIIDGLAWYYFSPDRTKKDGEESSKFILKNYDWDKINILWRDFFFENEVRRGRT